MSLPRRALRPAPVGIRRPVQQDAAAVWTLVRETGALDLNSPYAYLLLCHHFADTCRVAEREGQMVGCVLGYRPPAQPDALFVWQIGVDPKAHGEGIARALLEALFADSARQQGVRFLEATVTPLNTASRALFTGFAHRHSVPCQMRELFPAADFPFNHPGEQLLRIGPLEPETLTP